MAFFCWRKLSTKKIDLEVFSFLQILNSGIWMKMDIDPTNDDGTKVSRKNINANQNKNDDGTKAITFIVNVITFKEFDKCSNK